MMNHLNLVADRFSIHEHGLRQEDLLKKDRQNWVSIQRIMFLRVKHCISKIQEGYSGIVLISTFIIHRGIHFQMLVAKVPRVNFSCRMIF
mgnify:FL=1